MHTNLRINGMECENCVDSVKKALLDIPGVDHADVSLSNGAAQISHQSAIMSCVFVSALDGIGFDSRESN